MTEQEHLMCPRCNSRITNSYLGGIRGTICKEYYDCSVCGYYYRFSFGYKKEGVDPSKIKREG